MTRNLEGMLTREERINGEKIGADGEGDHGEGEAKEFYYDGSAGRPEVIAGSGCVSVSVARLTKARRE